MALAIEPRDYTVETELTGRVRHIYFSSETFTAGIIVANSGSLFDRDVRFSIKSQVNKDEQITLKGKWEQDKKFGWQFKANSLVYPMPDMSVEGLADYLANNPEFCGIGPVKAKLIADNFGANFDDMIRNHPEEIAIKCKLTPETIETLQHAWVVKSDLNAISTWLSAFGLTHNQCKKIASKYGNKAKKVLSDDPYLLMQDIDGFGFSTVDEIALKMGVSKEHPGRIRACLIEMVKHEADEGGHTYIERKNLIKAAIAKLCFDTLQADALVRKQLSELCKAESLLVQINCNDSSYIALKKLYQREMDILKWLSEAKLESFEITDEQFNSMIKTAVDKIGLTPTESQQAAAKMAWTSRISVMSGGAGTGKSYTINLIRRMFLDSELTVGMCAPTGKAAKRLEQLTGDPTASTIHRFLDYNPRLGGFQYNSENQLEFDLVIVDETSMCDVNLLWHLFSAIDFSRTKLLLVGDHNQLPPIGPGNVLRDVLNSKIVPCHILTECHRAAGELKLNCNAILKGAINKSTKVLPGTNTAREWHLIDSLENEDLLIDTVRLLMSKYFYKWHFNFITDCFIVTPQNKGKLGVNRLNLECQRVYQKLKYNIDLPEPTKETWDKRGRILCGDRVMCIKNSYDLGIMNGSVGVVIDIKPKESDNGMIYFIDFDGNTVEIESGSKEFQNIVLAYAATCHKLQGSEYPCITTIIHKTHTFMLSRSLFYTAVTRARKTTIVIGDKLGMRRAMQNTKVAERKTWLGLTYSN